MRFLRTSALVAGLVVSSVALATDGPSTSVNPNVRPTADFTMPVGPVVPPGTMERTNLGEDRLLEFTGHVLDAPAAGGVGTSILYAPSDPDDPALRDAISLLSGGICDYFDARVGVPDLGLLQVYDCVFTWADSAYFDNVAFGDVLADYVDSGGTVVMGAFCTYTTGNFLSGRIMTPEYCPVVSPTGTNLFAFSQYAGDGVTCIYDGVAFLECQYRDDIVLQGAGIQDGSYVDGAICAAYRPDGRVVYLNGVGGLNVLCNGDQAQAVVNAASCLGSAIDCACDGIYDVGDRVVAIVENPAGNPGLGLGHRGTAIAGSPIGWVLVMWDEFDGGHDGNDFTLCPSTGGGGSFGPIVLPGKTGWYVPCDQIASVCPTDLDGNLDTGFSDLLEVLGNWGSCF